MDVMYDHLADNRCVRLFNMINNCNRGRTGNELDFPLPSGSVTCLDGRVIE